MPLRLLEIGLDRAGKMSGLLIGIPWNKVQEPAVPVRCELRDAGIQWPAGDTMLDCSEFYEVCVSKGRNYSGGSKIILLENGCGLNLSGLEKRKLCEALG